jgi:putative PIN family toxin of toxin-antitoxin system
MRIVADTNTVISGLLWQGTPRRLINACQARKITLITSPALLAELAEVLVRDKFASRILRAKLSAKDLLEDDAAITSVIEPIALPEPVSRDPDDDQVIACAVTARVDAIVSGDADLLALKSYQDIPILTAQQAIDRIESRS